ncbi:phenylacetaldehyde reductase-like [Syzygium oleosum]|uniref:phenylacetaldehyde reductase-like n=1 Tax=Syzygium oleosum TaxID=219896 RepID=UPI0024BA399B|nr:phenylacetaldehyde reductase-like [Syzygium oleosum]
MSTADKVLCVTGGTGYIASWLVKSLLQRGYTVKATVQDPDDPMKTQHLRALEGAKGRLHLCKADLQEEGSFDSAINGCEAVFHTASPVLFSASDPQVFICEDDGPLVSAYRVSRERVEGLGATFIPLEVSVRDSVDGERLTLGLSLEKGKRSSYISIRLLWTSKAM